MAKFKLRNFKDEDKVLLLEKGRRGALRVVFGRTTLILVLMVLQLLLLVWVFSPLNDYSGALYSGISLAAVGIVLHLVNQRGDPTAKLTWIVLVLAVPLVGVALYLFVKLDVGHRVVNHRLKELEEETARFVPRQKELMNHLEQTDPDFASLARYTMRCGGFPAYDNTAVTYFPLGDKMFPELLRQLESAKKFIFLEFFIINEGYMWGRVLKILEKKVQQGVEVRVLYDGTCALFNLPYRYPKELRALGIQCKMFSPIRPLVSTYYNNRDHRKIVVVDGHTAFTGGVNLSDEYINLRPRFGHWKDTAVMVEGDAVRSFTLMFLQMWNVDQRREDYRRYLYVTCPRVEGRQGYVLPYADSPLDGEQVGQEIYMDILNRARRYVHIMTPYLIIDDKMANALTFAAKRGVEVAILLPHIPDKKYAFALAKTHYRQLLEAGVQIWEYTPGFVHAKSFVSDGCKAVVGTINLDYRSLSLHFECAAYLRDVPAVADVENDFQSTLKVSRRISLNDLRKIPLSTRLMGKLLKILAPLM